MNQPTDAAPRVPLATANPIDDRLSALRRLLPEAFAEGKLAVDKLATLLGERGLAAGPERYGLTWAGKSEAIRALQAPSVGTLLPDRAQSVDFDTTGNLIIEGDNLEVLKLLQRSYYGKVKVICIDPPYNTGNEFIYPDNYAEGLQDYLKFSQQVSEGGVRLTTNAETDGRYHSRWLSMMYPRLFLARNLLREDGVIFVSIDDHEVHNLRLVMNEIFGEENFVAEICWRNVTDNNPTLITKDNEFILCYGRSLEALPQEWKSHLSHAKETLQAEYARLKSLGFSPPEIQTRIRDFISDNEETLEVLTRYKFVDDTDVYTGSESVHNPRPGGYQFEVFHPITGKPMRKPANGYRFPEATFRQMEASGLILYGEDENRIVKIKKYLRDFEDTLRSVITLDGRLGSYDLKRLFGDSVAFTNPKPVELVKSFVSFAGSPNALVVDFFAGSGTTAHAVLELNKQDGGNRKFILVQLPEPTGREDFKTIADITRERVRRVIRKFTTEGTERTEIKQEEFKLESSPVRSASSVVQNPDLGFRAFTLASSNFKIWDATQAPTDAAGLAGHLKQMVLNLEDGRADEAILYEIILKSGLSLTAPVERVEAAGKVAWRVDGGALIVCLDRALTIEALRALIALKPRKVICLDAGFAGNDALKTNVVLEMKSHGVEFATA